MVGISAAVGVLGSAVLGAGASVIAGSKNSKAINKATDAQTASNQQSVALQRDVFNQNKATLAPYVNRGNPAGDTINALLGLGGSPMQQQQQPNALAQFQPAGQAYGLGDGYVGAGSYLGNNAAFRNAYPNAPLGYDGRPDGFTQPNALAQFQGGPIATGVQTGAQGQTAQQAANSAFDTFRGSTGYQFRLSEGLDAVNSNWFGAGLGQSGAALKALNEYGQNFASNEFGNYMGYLGQQQGTGLQAAGAQAGVGVNYANNVSNLNQANANALGQSAVASANNSNAVIGGIGNAFGGAIGALAYRPQG
jgi:hypothetical protein